MSPLIELLNLISFLCFTGVHGFGIHGVNGSILGTSVSFVGDINKDGTEDIVLGAHGVGSLTHERSAVAYLILGKAFGFPDLDLSVPHAGPGVVVIHGFTTNSLLGYNFAAAGDVDGDGFHDIAFNVAGNVVVVFGAAILPDDIDLSSPTSYVRGYTTISPASKTRKITLHEDALLSQTFTSTSDQPFEVTLSDWNDCDLKVLISPLTDTDQVICQVNVTYSPAEAMVAFTIVRDDSVYLGGADGLPFTTLYHGDLAVATINIVDTPATTTTTLSYRLVAKSLDGEGFIVGSRTITASVQSMIGTPNIRVA